MELLTFLYSLFQQYLLYLIRSMLQIDSSVLSQAKHLDYNKLYPMVLMVMKASSFLHQPFYYQPHTPNNLNTCVHVCKQCNLGPVFKSFGPLTW